jgi:GMP synthase (glutamine-hydrolysing)
LTLSEGNSPQIYVLDTGGQYCHLITRKIRELGVYSEIRPSETQAAELQGAKGLVISGGPASVYEPGSPTTDPAIYTLQAGVLGICYGQQLMAYQLGGRVQPGERGEYGLAWLDTLGPAPLFRNIEGRQQIWMSHRDTVTEAPPGFSSLAKSDTCAIAAIGDPSRRLYGVQFHPEVVHTERGRQVLSNFLFDICGCTRDWNLRDHALRIEEEIRRKTGDRKVFFFVSGGVDSTVAFTLCLRALGPGHVHGLYVDTGLMREGETEFVSGVFDSLAGGVVSVEHAQQRFLTALDGVTGPEEKRHIIGESFVTVQEEILESGHYLEADWILGQGTIYPDTIESGGSARADVIKTHHNRVPGIQKLIDEGRIIEPLHLLYKDEVREVGRELGLPEALLTRHPFPGPGLAIRCLCAEADLPLEKHADGWIAPVQSVGVQGDSRSYRSVLVLEDSPNRPGIHEHARHIINRNQSVNRVVVPAAEKPPVTGLRVRPASLNVCRLNRLRAADAMIRKLSTESGFESQIWQFPVILIPLGTEDRPDSVVLRPVDSVDGMTARAVSIPADLLQKMCDSLQAIPGVAAVFCDLTHKPPGTIEWE